MPLEDRFEIVIDITVPNDYTTMDKVLTVGIVVMMIASVSLLIYIIVVPREGEAFTEFYILGPSGKAEGYPRNIHIQEEKFLLIGVGNHEHKRTNYTIVLTIDGKAGNSTVDSLDHVTISRTTQPSIEILVGDGKTLEIPCNFSILETGAYKMRLLLFRNGKEYRDLHIWIKVFSENGLKRSSSGDVEMFITGPDGDPSTIPGSIPSGQILEMGIGVRNLRNEPLDLSMLLRSGSGGSRTDITSMNGTIILEHGKDYLFDIHVNATSSLDVLPVHLLLPDGDDPLSFSFNLDGETVTLTKTIKVGV